MLSSESKAGFCDRFKKFFVLSYYAAFRIDSSLSRQIQKIFVSALPQAVVLAMDCWVPPDGEAA